MPSPGTALSVVLAAGLQLCAGQTVVISAPDSCVVDGQPAVTIDECKEACLQLGDCAEVNMANNGCCYPAQSMCVGTQRGGDTKHVVEAC